MFHKNHASQLYNYGFPMQDIGALQGRSKNNAHQLYFIEDPKKLKEKYSEHVYLTINYDAIQLDEPEGIVLSNINNDKLKKTKEIFLNIKGMAQHHSFNNPTRSA